MKMFFSYFYHTLYYAGWVICLTFTGELFSQSLLAAIYSDNTFITIIYESCFVALNEPFQIELVKHFRSTEHFVTSVFGIAVSLSLGK